MKVKIQQDEWWPVLSISETTHGYPAELTDEEIEQVRATFAAFADAQDLLRQAVCRVRGHKRRESDRKWIEGQGTVRGAFVSCDWCGVDMDESVRPTA